MAELDHHGPAVVLASSDLVVERDEGRLIGESYAVFSACGTWRYSLVRRFGPGPLLRVIGLNPSTADAMKDDPTVARCVKRAADYCGGLGHSGGLVMQNLFGLRSTDPSGLLAVADPVGPHCTQMLLDVGEPIGATLVAWGSGGSGALQRLVKDRVEQVVEVLGSELYCLGTTADGSPRHPLYLSYDVTIQPWTTM